MIDPGNEEDYERLLRTLVEKASLPERVIHCWSVTGPSAQPSNEECQRLGFESLMALTRALSTEGNGAPFEITVISLNSTSGLNVASAIQTNGYANTSAPNTRIE